MESWREKWRQEDADFGDDDQNQTSELCRELGVPAFPDLHIAMLCLIGLTKNCQYICTMNMEPGIRSHIKNE